MKRFQVISARTVALYEVNPGPCDAEYAEGYERGRQWALEDRASYTPPHESLAMFHAEAQSDQRWARAFYLGARRGYRSIVRIRTFVRDADGEAISERWGT